MKRTKNYQGYEGPMCENGHWDVFIRKLCGMKGVRKEKVGHRIALKSEHRYSINQLFIKYI